MPWEKKLTEHAGVFLLDSSLSVCAADEEKKSCQMLNKLLEEIQVTIKYSPSGQENLKLKNNPALPPEGYCLTVKSDEISAEFSDVRGLRNALITLYLHIKRSGNGYVIPCGTIEDAPDSSFRAVMLDMAREYIPVWRVKQAIRLMALAKMNYLVLHLMDSGHYAIHSEVCPELNGKSKLQQYTQAEIKEIIRYADFFGLEIVPSLDMPGHASHLIECYDLGCKVEDEFPYSPWAVCVGQERTYEVLEKLMGEAASLFPGKYFAAYGDELEFLDIDFQRLWVNWEHCEYCRETARREGIAGKRQMFYYFIRRIHAILQKYGKTMWVANDNIDIKNHPDIPKDIIIIWWRVPAPGRGPIEGNCIENYLKAGFQVINIEYPDCYLDLYMKEEQLADWSPVKRPYCPPEYRQQVLGGYMCTWEGKRHYEWTMPSAIIMFGDRLWDHTPRIYDVSYREHLTRILLGARTPEGMDVFSMLGGCLLPLDVEKDRKGYPDRIGPDAAAKMDAVYDELGRLEAEEIREAELARVYQRCIRWMQNELKT